MFNANHIAVFNLVQDTAPNLPVAERIKVYLGLADMVGNAPQADDLKQMARALQEAEKQCAELKLTFKPEAK